MILDIEYEKPRYRMNSRFVDIRRVIESTLRKE